MKTIGHGSPVCEVDGDSAPNTARGLVGSRWVFGREGERMGGGQDVAYRRLPNVKRVCTILGDILSLLLRL